MIKKMNGVDWTAFVLTIIGGINWGLIGIFGFDLVATLFGGTEAIIARIIYSLVGVSAVYLAFAIPTKKV